MKLKKIVELEHDAQPYLGKSLKVFLYDHNDKHNRTVTCTFAEMRRIAISIEGEPKDWSLHAKLVEVDNTDVFHSFSARKIVTAFKELDEKQKKGS